MSLVPRYNRNDYSYTERILNRLNVCPENICCGDQRNIRNTIIYPRLNVYVSTDPNQMVKIMEGKIIVFTSHLCMKNLI
jgi:hypothetical protein